MKFRNIITGLSAGILFSISAYGQQPDSTSSQEEEDYSQYGDASDETTKFCTQKVRLLSPTKLISIGYEYQAPFTISFKPEKNVNSGTGPQEQKITYFGGARWQANAPVISNNKFIINLAANYYESMVKSVPSENNFFGEGNVLSSLKPGLRTMGISATAFKPLDEKHFIIASVSGDFNGNFSWDNFQDYFPIPTLTFAALYGWKKSENFMWALGATQTWRGGEKLYVPVLLMNKTFNDKWGLEMLLPARAHVRYNFSPQSLMLAGFEIEGNSYRMLTERDAYFKNGISELRRSELKFRMIYEQKLTGFIWLSAQVGWRLNYKFNFSEDRSSGRSDFVFTSKLGNPLYAGLSLNLVSP
jgi:hypothetical protein